MANETVATIRGFAGSAVTLFNNKDGSITASVNVGVTPSYYSSASQRFEDGPTVWYTVRARGNLASNMAESITTGTPLIARGKLSTRTWSGEDGHTHTRLTLAADGVGVDLTTGKASFIRVKREENSVQMDAEPQTASYAPVWEEIGDENLDNAPPF